MRVWRHNRPPSFLWNWIPAIFPWAQGWRSCTYAKSFLYVSGYSQYSRRIIGPILWYSEWFISTWYFSWNITFFGSGVLCVNHYHNYLQGRNEVRWRPHFRTRGLSEANVLHRRKYLWNCLDFSALPAVISRPGNCAPLVLPSLCSWLSKPQLFEYRFRLPQHTSATVATGRFGGLSPPKQSSKPLQIKKYFHLVQMPVL